MRALFFILFLTPYLSQSQCLRGNCENGSGVYRFDDGSKYEGEFVNGRIGHKGIFYFANGDKYLGEWMDQMRHGEGKLIYATGDVYTGQFEENRFSGYGEITYIEGDVYKGMWEDNLPNGEGAMYYHDGRVERGTFVDGALDEGEVEDAPQEVAQTPVYHDLDFERNHVEEEMEAPKEKPRPPKRNNERNKFDEDDEWDDDFEALAEEKRKEVEEEARQDVFANYHQEIPEDIRVLDSAPDVVEESSEDFPSQPQQLKDCSDGDCHNEEGFFEYNDGSRFEGFFKEGQPNGRGVCYYANGDKYVGQWHDHSPHGEGIMYFINGKVFGAVWDHGQPVGELKAKESLDLVKDIYTEKDDETRVWAVVIGVSRYNHMPVLRYSDDDAYRIYAFLKSPEGGALPDEQIKIVIDEDATREKILKVLQHTLLKADENDVVMVYFSGHGLEGSFVPIDFDGYENLIQHEEVIEILSASKARYKMCFADACHSGSLTASKSADVQNTIDKYYNAFLDIRGGTAFMLSSKAEEFSLEDGGLRQGVFSHFLIRGMKGEADVDFNDVVTIDELFKFVHFEVRRYTGNVQTPVMLGRYDKRMPVSVVRTK